MAYDERLAQRVRLALADRAGLTERAMFGGLAFMVGGHMCCGVLKDELVVRLASTDAEAARAKPHVRAMDFTGRPMKGYVMVGAPGCRTQAATTRWANLGADFVRGLPPKAAR